ncbi:MAG TPA: tetratricopeptide repeat protein, partial [Armatimonadetes bacterium]|nr:tetratricopeptide repeat protein [Armatimonadota bacterium]
QQEIEQYMHLASVYEESGFPRRARDYLQKALKIDPDNPEVLLRLGRVELELGNHASAEDFFERLLSRHPQWATDVEKLKREMMPQDADEDSSMSM